MKYVQRKDGEWIKLHPKTPRHHRISCCDCGLVHDLYFRIIGGRRIEFRAVRNQRATGQKRRKTV